MKVTRNTVQRDMVLAAVQQLHHHPTAEEIYHAVSSRYANIGKGTVYRNLNLLAEVGEIQKISVPDAADRFDFNTASHYHLKFSSCDRVYDVDMAYQQDIVSKIRNTNGFLIQRHDIVFQGICPECNEQKKEKEKQVV